MSNTTKNTQSILGYQEYINATTGEVERFQVLNKEEKSDFNFHKVWIKMICSLMEHLGSSKNTVVSYIFQNINAQNILIASISKIAKDTFVSVRTVKETLRIMKEIDCLRMVTNAVYQVNPNLLFRGKSIPRIIQLNKYHKLPKLEKKKVA